MLALNTTIEADHKTISGSTSGNNPALVGAHYITFTMFHKNCF
jgi:hypothetical protein